MQITDYAELIIVWIIITTIFTGAGYYAYYDSKRDQTRLSKEIDDLLESTRQTRDLNEWFRDENEILREINKQLRNELENNVKNKT